MMAGTGAVLEPEYKSEGIHSFLVTTKLTRALGERKTNWLFLKNAIPALVFV